MANSSSKAVGPQTRKLRRIQLAVLAEAIVALSGCGAVRSSPDDDSGEIARQESDLARHPNAPSKPRITVRGRATQELEAGEYGELTLATGSRSTNTLLRLSGGQFAFSSIELGNHARIECTNPCSIEVAEDVRTGFDSFIGPSLKRCVNPAEVTLTAHGLHARECRARREHDPREFELFRERGHDPRTRQPDIDIGPKNDLGGRFFAPNGTIRVGAGSTGQVDLEARHVALGHRVDLAPAGAPFNFDDGNVCTIDGSCDYATGEALHTPVAEGTPCNDQDLCTTVDTCQSGLCTGGAAVGCQAVDACHDAGTCSPSTGVCAEPAKADGTPCDDGNVCTQMDHCEVGACVGGKPVTCAPLDACHQPGVCEPSTGCTNPLREGASCSGDDFFGATCASVTDGSRPFGALSCTSACTLDSGACTPAPRMLVYCTATISAYFFSATVSPDGSYRTATWMSGQTGSSTVTQLSAEALSALVAAVNALDASTAGYGHYVGPNTHNMPHRGELDVYGLSKGKILVDSLVDTGAGVREIYSAKDPAAIEVRKYACGDLVGLCPQGPCTACTPGQTGCVPRVDQPPPGSGLPPLPSKEVHTCNANGDWGPPTTCTFVCDPATNACGGECIPFTHSCLGDGTRTCTPNATWESPTTCPMGCDAATNLCVPECDPGMNGCLGNGTRTCAADGTWGPASECFPACDRATGRCGGVCIPGTVGGCSGPPSNGLVTCNESGQWGPPERPCN